MKKLMVVALLAVLGLALQAPAHASQSGSGLAQIAKKCKKKRGHRAATAKKKCKKKKPPSTTTPSAPSTTTPSVTPKPLTDAEVISRLYSQGAVYCSSPDFFAPFCPGHGVYFDGDPTHARCDSKSTFSWSCLGYLDFDSDGDDVGDQTCDFREVVERTGIDGITSHQDVSYGTVSGFDCYPNSP
jgi:hypothetical protein